MIVHVRHVWCGTVSLSACVGYRVEEAFKVNAHAVFITLGDIFLRPLQCLVAATVRAEAKAVVVELAFIDRT